MNFNEYAAKQEILAPAGIPVLPGRLCHNADEAAQAISDLGPCAIKAQVPVGKRGKAGGIKLAQTKEDALSAAHAILGMTIGGYEVGAVLAEQAAAITKEYYAAVLHAPAERASLVLFCAEGGMDIEELAIERPEAIRHFLVKTPDQFSLDDARSLTQDLTEHADEIAHLLVTLYCRYRETDAELLEINPLAQLSDGRIVALDCKFILDDAARSRQQNLASHGAPPQSSALEREAAALDLKYIELDGEIGILANGAGLTMTTMDVISHFGGRPANFMEIGGDAYTKAEEALRIVLKHSKLRSLVINFCGAFARTDVMAEGVVKAWKKLNPNIPVFFSVHGTGEDKAVALIKAELGITPYDLMEDAVQAAIGAVR